MSNSTSTPNTGLSYKDAGVDIEAGDALVDRIKSVAKRTTRPEVMGGLGGFGALCKIPKGNQELILNSLLTSSSVCFNIISISPKCCCWNMSIFLWFVKCNKGTNVYIL